MKPDPVPSALFRRNRSKLRSALAPGSAVLIRSGEAKIRSGDQYYPYRQLSDFYYLTGIVLKDSLLTICPDHPDPSLREVLFIRRSTPKSDLWSGPLPGLEEASKLSGIEQVRWLEEKDTLLKEVLRNVTLLYADQEFREASHASRMPLHPLIEKLRMIKEVEEVDQIRKAVSITHNAFRKLLTRVKPGVKGIKQFAG